LVVVPSQPDVRTVLLELLERAGGVLGDAPVVTFDGLTRAALNGAPSGPERVLGGFEKELMWAAVLDGAELQTLSYLQELPGGARALGGVLDELEEGGLEPEEAQTALDRWAGMSGEQAAPAADLLKAYVSYRALCEERETCSRSAWVLAAASSPLAWRRPVACYGFSSFTPVQRSLLRRLAESAPVLVVLPYEEGRWAARTVEAELLHWRPIAVTSECLPEQTVAYSSAEIAHLERSFMQEGMLKGHAEHALAASAAPPASPVEGADVRVLISSGRRNEAELVAGEIVDLLRVGYGPGDIAVLVRSAAPWARLLQQVFSAVGIPLRLDAQVPFGHTGLGHALLHVCRAALHGTGANLLAFLRTPYHELDSEEIDRLEHEYACTFPQGMRVAEFDAALDLLPDSAGSLRRVLLPLGVPSREFRHLLELAAHMFGCALSRLDDSDPYGRRQLEHDAKALRALTEALQGLVLGVSSAAAASAPSTPHWGFERVVEALAALPVWLPEGSPQGVRVMTVARAHANRFRAVFVLGLVESEFPQTGERSGLLSARDRNLANAQTGLPLFRNPPEGEDPFLFWSALSRPWELLYLSTRETDEEGAAEIPSPFLEEVFRILGRSGAYRSRGLARVVYDLERAPSPREYLRACAAAGLSPPSLPGREYAPRPAPWSEPPSALCSAAVLQELASLCSFSASELESYCTCPFGWFVSRIIDPKDAYEEWGAREAGSLAHQLLDVVFSELGRRQLLPLGFEALDEALGLAKSALNLALSPESVVGCSAEGLLLRQQVAQYVFDVLRMEAGTGSRFVTTETERVIRSAVQLAPGLAVRGKVDRIDRHPGDDGAFVVDYKLGGKHKTPFSESGLLQVPLYMRCLEVLEPDRPVHGGAYLSLRDRARVGLIVEDRADELGTWLRSAGWPAGEMRAEVDRCVLMAAEAADGMRAGRIPALPRRMECPSYCRGTTLCHVHRKPRGRR
jgi:ATP-dependent helicase/DNAse subunit B